MPLFLSDKIGRYIPSHTQSERLLIAYDGNFYFCGLQTKPSFPQCIFSKLMGACTLFKRTS